MSPYLPAILFSLVVASAIRGNLLAHSLLQKGHFLFEGRASFRKIRRALYGAQTDADKQAILRFRRWYILHVILFWIALASAFSKKMGVSTNVVDLSKKRCFHGGKGIDNEVICSEYIRRGGVIAENHQKIIGSK